MFWKKPVKKPVKRAKVAPAAAPAPVKKTVSEKKKPSRLKILTAEGWRRLMMKKKK